MTHQLADSSHEGLQAMALALGSNVRVVSVKQLVGGIMSVYLIELIDSASRRAVVLKQFPPGVGTPRNEWDALSFAHSAGLSSPEPFLFDDGSWFGGPAIVMEALPGQLCLDPPNVKSWTAALAEALAAIHATAIDTMPESMRRQGIWSWWDASGLTLGPRTDAVSAALAELRARTWVTSFCHCDFHPGNVLFDDGVVVGVIDWTSAKLSPLLNDVGRLRAAVALYPGGDSPDLVSAAYAERTGRSLEGLAYWDLLAGAVTLQGAEAILRGEAKQHPLYEHLGAVEVVDRATSFIDTALSRLNLD